MQQYIILKKYKKLSGPLHTLGRNVEYWRWKLVHRHFGTRIVLCIITI